MDKEVLKDAKGHKIATIETSNGKSTIRDKKGHKLGAYDEKTNTTRDKKGHKVGTGNLLTSLIDD